MGGRVGAAVVAGSGTIGGLVVGEGVDGVDIGGRAVEVGSAVELVDDIGGRVDCSSEIYNICKISIIKTIKTARDRYMLRICFRVFSV